MAAYTQTLTLIAAVLVIFGGGLVVYLTMTFALMRPHAPSRSFGASARALLREATWIALTQPLLPLFYLFGGRFAARAHGIPVVLVHGYMHNRIAFVGLGRALAKRGLGPIFAINYPWFASVESNARRLRAFVERVLAETHAPHVDLVCHSMGGLVAIELLRTSVERDPPSCVAASRLLRPTVVCVGAARCFSIPLASGQARRSSGYMQNASSAFRS